jgi:hypothetical protein
MLFLHRKKNGYLPLPTFTIIGPPPVLPRLLLFLADSCSFAMPMQTRSCTARRSTLSPEAAALTQCLVQPVRPDPVAMAAFWTAYPHVREAMPPVLRELYEFIGAPTQPAALSVPEAFQALYQEREDAVEGRLLPPTTWTLWSLADVANAFAYHGQWHAQNTNLDVASLVHGMGHYIALSVDIPTGSVYMRLAGGSDGWAVELDAQSTALYQAPRDVVQPIAWWTAHVLDGTTVDALEGVYVTL